MARKTISDFGSFFGTLERRLSEMPSSGNEKDIDNYDLPKQKAKRYSEDTDHRKRLITWVKWNVSGSLILTFVILFLNGVANLSISNGVLIALLTTTTANILGLAFIVLGGMFGMFNVKEDQEK